MDEYRTPIIDTAIFTDGADAIGIGLDHCPACHTKTPGYLFHETGDESFALARAQNGALKMNGMEVLVLECTTCGYLLMFNRERFMERVAIAEHKRLRVNDEQDQTK
ncbi:hypothetical protein [Burkholderia pseudomallei]|uniref:hypothetical protein n=1 Tax=Burkholderia pseudomallei TaxID=28450 RepID=UPI0005C8B2B3|nr:hypothetical protein [Burkholderia pseudomallei]KIX70142.1 hypothetical protein SZ30_00475 [Burkholderia pseudomallei]